MRPQTPVFRLSSLATLLALVIGSAGCGNSADLAVSVAEAAVAGTAPTAQSNPDLAEASKGERRRLLGSGQSTTSSSPTTVLSTSSTNTSVTETSNLITAQTSLSALPLLTKESFVHIGAFRATVGNLDKPNTLSSGGNVLAYNGAKNSLIIDGHVGSQYLAEISIPNDLAFDPRDITSLSKNTVLQPISNALENKLPLINPGDPNPQYAGGILSYQGQLIIGAYSMYDALGTQSASHFTRSLDLGATNSMSAPITLPGVIPRWVGGAMTEIPQEWQASLGGTVLTGIGGMSIGATSSNGPSAAVIDPQNLVSTKAVQLVGYPLELPLSRLYGHGNDVQNPIWNRLTQARGIIFPKGSRSVLFYGRHGLGPLCYGTGVYCNDPAISDKGYHSYPYTYQVWAYDALDFVRVKNGLSTPDSIKPYAVWTLDLPFQENSPSRPIGQVAYDPSTGRVFISQIHGYSVGYTAEPVIHVFKIQ